MRHYVKMAQPVRLVNPHNIPGDGGTGGDVQEYVRRSSQILTKTAQGGFCGEIKTAQQSVLLE